MGNRKNEKTSTEFARNFRPNFVAENEVKAYLSLLYTSRAVKSQIRVSVIGQERLQHVQHTRHLRENQNSTGEGKKRRKEMKAEAILKIP